MATSSELLCGVMLFSLMSSGPVSYSVIVPGLKRRISCFGPSNGEEVAQKVEDFIMSRLKESASTFLAELPVGKRQGLECLSKQPSCLTKKGLDRQGI